jgi:hypothetical protein
VRVHPATAEPGDVRQRAAAQQSRAEAQRDEYQRAVRRLVGGVTQHQVMEGLDKHYANERNRDLLVTNAVPIVLLQLRTQQLDRALRKIPK